MEETIETTKKEQIVQVLIALKIHAVQQERIPQSGQASIVGGFSVLTPSQKRALEKEEEKKRQKEDAQKWKREEEALEKERQKQAKKHLYIIILIVSIVCSLGWTLYAALNEFGFITGVVALLFAIPAMYGGAKLGDL